MTTAEKVSYSGPQTPLCICEEALWILRVRKTQEKCKRDQHGVHRDQQSLGCTEEVAAQNDYIYTRSYKVNCMGGAGDTHCRQ